MKANAQISNGRSQYWGVASLVAPLAGLGVGYLVFLSMTGEAGLAAPFVWLVIFCGFSFVGFIFAVIGIRKRERFPVLPWLGLILDLVPILYLLIFVLDYR